MKRIPFLELATQRVVVLDGAMGSNLQQRTLDLQRDWMGHENCSEILNLTRPDVIREIHESFLAVGCDAVETNTFGANKIVLAEACMADRVVELNRIAAQIARRPATNTKPPTSPNTSSALGLTWDDVDLVAGKATIGATLHRTRDPREPWQRRPTKTGRTRSVPLGPLAVAALAEHKARLADVRQPDWRYFGLVFLTETGPALPRHRRPAALVRDAGGARPAAGDDPRAAPHRGQPDAVAGLRPRGRQADPRPLDDPRDERHLLPPRRGPPARWSPTAWTRRCGGSSDKSLGHFWCNEPDDLGPEGPDSCSDLEATTGFEPVNRGFADL